MTEVAQHEPFRLFWWVPKSKGINLGDEISPLVLSHVSGREVVRGSPNDCDGIAIGSVFNPGMADARKRTKPLFVWGSGTGKPSPCSMRQMSVTISALRGPLTAGQIEGCPDVPFGDPGLFVREIWPGPAEGTERTKVGLIPHHSMLKHPALKQFKQAFGDVVILDFTDPDIAKTLSRLAHCSRVVSSSLHGLIFADAYGIPSLFWKESETTVPWKYQDYFEGVGREGFCHRNSTEIVETTLKEGIDALPFSHLPEQRCLQVLDGLREAVKAMP
ncbi:polysaccharide pyruvyl transferase family protein [Paracoccus sp. (in: a-proteobacteria)]|uniref:polysaccharide pyruvyl transferase family protein n=1 Tax=Paracoccus sp. TaxID=267 RepID=UPI00272B5B2E|nr:polysaccharide pyruvyl transferase family protein [Paracoccus sp. (in: a-proteobacteria)]